jgi:alkylation response protein AidB-like acyl-CoA dehydrogenase
MSRGVSIKTVQLDAIPRTTASDLSAQSADGASAVRGSADVAIELAIRIGAAVPLPGSGGTSERWETLASVAAVDLTAARVLEPHLDAIAILAEARADGLLEDSFDVSPESSWGVFAAEGPGLRVDAASSRGGWILDGVKPWCSLAGRLTSALVTAFVSETTRALFAIDLRAEHVQVEPADGWVSNGLPDIPSVPIRLDGVPATRVGDDGWYLRRDGFSWGGMGVAACWYGGALGLQRRVAAGLEVAASGPRPADQVALLHYGSIDTDLNAARAVLSEAARLVDAGRARGPAGVVLALRVRNAITRAAERTLQIASHALGPAPLTFETEHARRVADLQVYLRQHHAERDEAALGRALLDGALRRG